MNNKGHDLWSQVCEEHDIKQPNMDTFFHFDQSNIHSIYIDHPRQFECQKPIYQYEVDQQWKRLIQQISMDNMNNNKQENTTQPSPTSSVQKLKYQQYLQHAKEIKNKAEKQKGWYQRLSDMFCCMQGQGEKKQYQTIVDVNVKRGKMSKEFI